MVAALVVASRSKLIRCNISFALFPFVTIYLEFQFQYLYVALICSILLVCYVISSVTRNVDILRYCYFCNLIILSVQ